MTCYNLVQQAGNGYNNINPYFVDGQCFNGAQAAMMRNPSLLRHLFPPHDPINRAAFYSADQIIVPCIDSDNADHYLNRAVATSALHVRGDITWAICSNTISVNYEKSGASMIPNYQTLINAGIRVFVYSGDSDSVVPWTGTAKWVLTETGFSGKTIDWANWNYVADGGWGPQVGGSVTQFSNGFTFSTIRGAGHMVPQFAPAKGYTMFQTVIQNLAWNLS